MNYNQAISLLEENRNEKNIELWNQHGSTKGKLKSYGIGLTVLRKLAKQIGKDRSLALELWDTNNYDAKIIALLIDDPKQITRDQVEMQVEGVRQGHLAHVFSSCGAPLAKTPFVVPLLVEWINTKDSLRQSCGYGLLYEVSKSKRKDAPSNEFFLARIQEIDQSFNQVPQSVKLAMGGALMGIGKRNAILNTSALKVARKISPIEIESDRSDCDPFDVVKHLTSDYIRNKLGV
ncbi:MAG: DNA alkylation repair protein [Bacteroidota bacterium]